MDESFMNLSFKGSLTIERAEEVKETLLKALNSNEQEIFLNLSDIEKIDISFLQILYAANLEAVSKNIKISLKGIVPESIRDVAKITGFDRTIGDNLHFLFPEDSQNKE